MIVERLLRVALVGSSWVLWLLIGLSVVSFTAMLERWLFFRRHRDDIDALRGRLHEALHEEDLETAEKLLAASPSIEARVIRSAIRWSHGGPEAVSDVVDSELAREKKNLERGLNLLGTLGNNTPFIGLLGTVLGVIEAFHHLADTSNKAAMGNVMAGIAEALVATGVGLFVALPAVIAFNVLNKKIGDIETGVVALSKLLTAFLKTSKLAEKQALEHVEVEVPPPAKANGAAKKSSNGASVSVA